MADKGKKQAEESAMKNATSAEDSIVDSVRDIPKMNPEDIAGQENPTVAMFNTFREMKMLTDAITGQGRLVNLMWSQHCELQKPFEEEKELTRKGILYSIERSGGYNLPDNQPTIREELLRSYKEKIRTERILDFDTAEEAEGSEGATAGEEDKDATEEGSEIKYGYIGSIHFP
ncbi:hypothetical protein PIB30_096467 [Stylosanthes scabra]|uniref:Uncharacterized protein n=1 Tax=Stylosanthes scabra TaxID=79078 RepID=A0ABU6RVY9_9FABA|nr:hypothetical protein [Stylosanthes scabra]